MRTFLVPGLFLLFKSLFDKLIFEYNALLMFLSVCSIGLRHTLNSQRIDPIFCWMQVILGLAILNCSLAPLLVENSLLLRPLASVCQLRIAAMVRVNSIYASRHVRTRITRDLL